MTVDELLAKIEEKADILIVDSRLEVEEAFEDGRIKGAVAVPFSTILEGTWEPPADLTMEIVIYCS